MGVTVFLGGSLTGEALAEEESFAQSAEYAIAASLGTAQNRVKVTEVTAVGRRLIEDVEGSSASQRRLSTYVLNIKYEVYLDDNDQLEATKSKLSDSVSATFAVELSEKERSMGRNTQVSSVYINKDIEVEEKTTRPPSNGMTQPSDSGSACIGPSCTTTIIVSTGDASEATVGEEEMDSRSTTGDPTTTEPDRLAVAGYTCPSRHLSYAVLFAGLVFAH